MAYTTAAKVYEAWADITGAEAGEVAGNGDPAQTRVTNAIAFADAMIDASLVHRYVVPFSSDPDTPPLIAAISTDFAVYIVKYRKDPRMVTDTQSLGERQVAIVANLLDQLRKGEINLPNVAERQMIESTMEDYTPIFNLDEEVEHVLDEDLADAIEDARD